MLGGAPDRSLNRLAARLSAEDGGELHGICGRLRGGLSGKCCAKVADRPVVAECVESAFHFIHETMARGLVLQAGRQLEEPRDRTELVTVCALQVVTELRVRRRQRARGNQRIDLRDDASLEMVARRGCQPASSCMVLSHHTPPVTWEHDLPGTTTHAAGAVPRTRCVFSRIAATMKPFSFIF